MSYPNVFGHSGLGSDLKVETKGVFIYDLKSLELIFDQELFWLNHNWGNEVLDNGEMSSSESIECYNLNMLLGYKKIILESMPSDECDSSNNASELETGRWIYELKGKSFIGIEVPTTTN